MSGEIGHVSDTAFWVASFRALESERSDALFRDPLARRLAGDKGRAIARAMPNYGLMAFIMAMRTTAIDRLILSALERGGVDTVLNLGAGLDTRPYRMDLPASLRWLEADFPELIAYKNQQLAGEQPRCRLERVAVDLADRSSRQALLERVGASASTVLVITEGVIVYLPDDEVSRLVEDVRAVPNLRYWIQDYYGVEPRRQRAEMKKKLAAAPFAFQAPHWFGFFAERGFVELASISTREEALRFGRRPPLLSPAIFLMLPVSAKWKQQADRMLGYTLLERRAP